MYEDARNEFIKKYWYYYSVLESDCLALKRFVAFKKDNLETFSDEIARQFLSAGAEFDNLCRHICGLEDEDETHIADYAAWLFNPENIAPSIRHVKIQLFGEELIFEPFKNWQVVHSDELFWWKDYNNIKHNRSQNYELGNLDNLLNALSAIYFLQCYQFRKIAQPEVNNEENPVFDVPPKRSELFTLLDFETRFTLSDYGSLFAVLGA